MVKLGKHISVLILLCLSVLCSEQVAYADPEISLSVTPTSGTLDDTFVLSIKINGTAETEYPILKGGDEFDVNLVGPESQIQVINGEVSQNVTYRYRLIPKIEGTYKSPSASVTIDGTNLDADGVLIKVAKPTTPDPSSPQKNDIFAEQQIDPTTLYVGQQAVYSLTTYAIPTPLEFNADSYSFDGFWTEDIGKLEKGNASFNGKQYTSIRLRKAVFPLKPGTTTLPARRINLKVRKPQTRGNSAFDIFGIDPFNDQFFNQAFGTVVDSNLRSNEIQIKVLPIPKAPRESGLLSLKSTLVGATSIDLSGEEADIKFGDSKTITIIIRSEGNINPISSLALKSTKDYRTYEDPPQTNRFEVAGKLVSEKTFKVSIVPEHGGRIQLNPIKLQFFDPDSKSYSIAATKPISFNVIGGPVPKADEGLKVQSQSKTNENPGSVSGSHEETLPAYESDSEWQKLSRHVSGSLIVLIIAALAALFILIRLVRSVSHSRHNLKDLRQKILAAQNVSDLNSALKEVFARLLSYKVSSLSHEELKAKIRADIHDKDMSFLAQSILDELDIIQYGGSNDTDLSRMKENALKLCT